MHATTVAVDLAKSVFLIAVVDDKWEVIEQQRLTRSQFERWLHNRDVELALGDPGNRDRHEICIQYCAPRMTVQKYSY